MSGARLFSPWRSPALPDKVKDLVAALTSPLRELERLLEDIRLTLSYGPVSGAYVPFHFTRYNTAGLPTGVVDATITPFSFRPLAVAVWVDDPASQLTIKLNYDDGSTVDVLSPTNWQFTGSDWKNTHASFAVDRIPVGAFIYPEVVSVGDGGSAVPSKITLVLWGKNASKIEDAA